MANPYSKIKIPDLVSKKPIISSILSKGNYQKTDVNRSILNYNIPDIFKSTSGKIRNNDDILELFPDVELSIRILVSSILSPNDMLSNAINYLGPDIRLPIGVKQSILSAITDYINKEYKFEDDLYTIVKEALFTKGAYITAIIPEASIDDVIHQVDYDKVLSIESYINNFNNNLNKHNYGFINNKPYTENIKLDIFNPTTTESLSIVEDDLNVSITDNFGILKLPNHLESFNSNLTRKKINPNYSSYVSKEDILDNIFKNNATMKIDDVVEINTIVNASRASVNGPLTLKLPTESVIPICVSNNPSKHLGYFILLDENGIPINNLSSYTSDQAKYDLESCQFSSGSSFNFIQKTKKALLNITKKDVMLKDLEDLYSNIIENMLRTKLKTGNYGDIYTLSKSTDIYRVMFYRALKAQKTKILYLPEELVSYIAFDYRDNGTGRSLIEKSYILFSLRAILLFTKMMANLKNSVTVTNITATLDDDDPDPERTMETIMSNALKTRQNTMPFGITNIDELVEWTHSVGFRFNFKGKGLPNMDLDVSDTSSSKIVPDDVLTEDINKMIYRSFGLTPEMIDAGYSVEYATTIVSNNLLFAKYIKQLQNILNPLLAKHVKKLIYNDPILQNNIKDIINLNMKDIKAVIKEEIKSTNINYKKIDNDTIIHYITRQYIENIDVYLAEPNVSEANNLDKALDVYVSNLDKYLPMLISQDAIPEKYAGEISNELEDIQKAVKTMLIKKWMADNNFLPEINDIMTLDIDNKYMFDLSEEFTKYIEDVFNTLYPLLKESGKIRNKLIKKLEAINEKYGNDSGGYDDSSSDDGGDDESGYDDEGEGGNDEDDFGMDDDMGEDEESTDDEEDDSDDSDNDSDDTADQDDNADDNADTADSGDSSGDNADGKTEKE